MTTLFQPQWWTQSRTLAFNLLVLIVGLVAEFTSLLQPYMTQKVYGIVILVVSVVNLLLRVLTQIKLAAQTQ